MIQVSAYGRLGGDPRSIETRSGKPMAVGRLAVNVGPDVDSPPLWLSILAFGRLAEELQRHAKGDLVSVSGRMQRKVYTTNAGETREQLEIVADSLISARTVRPKGGGKRSGGGDRKPDRPATDPHFDDEVPF